MLAVSGSKWRQMDGKWRYDRYRIGFASLHLWRYLRLLFSQEGFMKRLLLLLMLVAATWVGVSWGNVSAAAISPFKSPQPPPKQVIKFKFQGDNAYTDFYVTGGCISAYISVAAGESVVKDEPGKPETNSVATIQINGADSCTQRKFFGYGSANLSPDAFQLKVPCSQQSSPLSCNSAATKMTPLSLLMST